MTAPELQQSTRTAYVPQQRRRPRPVSLPPEGCGHDAYRTVRNGRHGGQAVECRVCGAVGCIEP